MRITLREEPLLKSIIYAIVCTLLMLFSYSFIPALKVSAILPNFLVAVISILALCEGVRYASFFALFFSVLETLMLNSNPFFFPLFYVVFAIVCTALFENVFVKNFFAWLCYTVVGLAIHQFIQLLAYSSNWDVSLAKAFTQTAVPAFVISAVVSMADNDVITVCPEQMGGLTTPRNPSEIVNGRLLMNNGTDVTEQYEKGANRVKTYFTCGFVFDYMCRLPYHSCKFTNYGSGLLFDNQGRIF